MWPPIIMVGKRWNKVKEGYVTDDICKKIAEKLRKDGERIVVGGNKYLYKSKYHLLYNKAIVKTVIHAFLLVMTEILAQGDSITLGQYMKIEPVYYPKRAGRNPKENKKIEIPAQYKPKVKFYKNIKEACKRIPINAVDKDQ